MSGRRIRVAIAINTFEAGGTEHQMTQLMCRLDRQQFEVSAVCLVDRGPLRARVEAAGLPILEFPVRGGLARPASMRSLLRLARWCRAQRIDVLHACDFYANVFALPAAFLARVPVRIASRRDLYVPERTPKHQALQRLSYRFAHRIVTNSAAAADCLTHEGVAKGKVRLIPNGLDLTRFVCGAPVSRRIVGMVANLRPGKGHEVLLDAAAILARDVPDLRLRIVGDGPRRDALEAQARTLGVHERVDFRGHQPDVPAELAACGIFAFASHMEASPNAVLEAMAAGLPVVATAVGGIPEVVEHERTGLLVPPGDPPALAAAIRRLIEDETLAATLAREGRQLIASRFSFERMTSEFEQLYLDELRVRRGDASPARTTKAFVPSSS